MFCSTLPPIFWPTSATGTLTSMNFAHAAPKNGRICAMGREDPIEEGGSSTRPAGVSLQRLASSRGREAIPETLRENERCVADEVPHNSAVEADVALSRCAPSGPRSLTPVVGQTNGRKRPSAGRL